MATEQRLKQRSLWSQVDSFLSSPKIPKIRQLFLGGQFLNFGGPLKLIGGFNSALTSYMYTKIFNYTLIFLAFFGSEQFFSLAILTKSVPKISCDLFVG